MREELNDTVKVEIFAGWKYTHISHNMRTARKWKQAKICVSVWSNVNCWIFVKLKERGIPDIQENSKNLSRKKYPLLHYAFKEGLWLTLMTWRHSTGDMTLMKWWKMSLSLMPGLEMTSTPKLSTNKTSDSGMSVPSIADHTWLKKDTGVLCLLQVWT